MLTLLVGASTHHQFPHFGSVQEAQERILLLAFRLVINAPDIPILSAIVGVAPASTLSRQTFSTLVSAGTWEAEQQFMIS